MIRKMRCAVLAAALCFGAPAFAQARDGDTPLHNAARACDVNAARSLLDNGADPDAANKAGSTPLHVLAAEGRRTPAARKARLETARLLLDAGANVNAADGERMTALHIALARQREELIGVLLDAGADVNAKGASERRPLYYAALSDNIKAIERLTAGGAKIDAVDKLGATALHAAALRFRLKATEALLALGADPNIANANEETPLHVLAKQHLHARESEQKLADVAEALIEGGAEVNRRAKDGSTPLSRAIEGHHSQLVRLLVQKGGTK